MRGIYNVTYNGVYQSFVYYDTQKGYSRINDFDLFNGWVTGDTISRCKLEKFLVENEK